MFKVPFYLAKPTGIEYSGDTTWEQVDCSFELRMSYFFGTDDQDMTPRNPIMECMENLVADWILDFAQSLADTFGSFLDDLDFMQGVDGIFSEALRSIDIPEHIMRGYIFYPDELNLQEVCPQGAPPSPPPEEPPPPVPPAYPPANPPPPPEPPPPQYSFKMSVKGDMLLGQYACAAVCDNPEGCPELGLALHVEGEADLARTNGVGGTYGDVDTTVTHDGGWSPLCGTFAPNFQMPAFTGTFEWGRKTALGDAYAFMAAEVHFNDTIPIIENVLSLTKGPADMMPISLGTKRTGGPTLRLDVTINKDTMLEEPSPPPPSPPPPRPSLPPLPPPKETSLACADVPGVFAAAFPLHIIPNYFLPDGTTMPATPREPGDADPPGYADGSECKDVIRLLTEAQAGRGGLNIILLPKDVIASRPVKFELVNEMTFPEAKGADGKLSNDKGGGAVCSASVADFSIQVNATSKTHEDLSCTDMGGFVGLSGYRDCRDTLMRPLTSSQVDGLGYSWQRPAYFTGSILAHLCPTTCAEFLTPEQIYAAEYRRYRDSCSGYVDARPPPSSPSPPETLLDRLKNKLSFGASFSGGVQIGPPGLLPILRASGSFGQRQHSWLHISHDEVFTFYESDYLAIRVPKISGTVWLGSNGHVSVRLAGSGPNVGLWNYPRRVIELVDWSAMIEYERDPTSGTGETTTTKKFQATAVLWNGLSATLSAQWEISPYTRPTFKLYHAGGWRPDLGDLFENMTTPAVSGSITFGRADMGTPKMQMKLGASFPKPFSLFSGSFTLSGYENASIGPGFSLEVEKEGSGSKAFNTSFKIAGALSLQALPEFPTIGAECELKYQQNDKKVSEVASSLIHLYIPLKSYDKKVAATMGCELTTGAWTLLVGPSLNFTVPSLRGRAQIIRDDFNDQSTLGLSLDTLTPASAHMFNDRVSISNVHFRAFLNKVTRRTTTTSRTFGIRMSGVVRLGSEDDGLHATLLGELGRDQGKSLTATIDHPGGWSIFTNGTWLSRVFETPAFSGKLELKDKSVAMSGNLSFPTKRRLAGDVITLEPGATLGLDMDWDRGVCCDSITVSEPRSVTLPAEAAGCLGDFTIKKNLADPSNSGRPVYQAGNAYWYYMTSSALRPTFKVGWRCEYSESGVLDGSGEALLIQADLRGAESRRRCPSDQWEENYLFGSAPTVHSFGIGEGLRKGDCTIGRQGSSQCEALMQCTRWAPSEATAQELFFRRTLRLNGAINVGTLGQLFVQGMLVREGVSTLDIMPRAHNWVPLEDLEELSVPRELFRGQLLLSEGEPGGVDPECIFYPFKEGCLLARLSMRIAAGPLPDMQVHTMLTLKQWQLQILQGTGFTDSSLFPTTETTLALAREVCACSPFPLSLLLFLSSSLPLSLSLLLTRCSFSLPCWMLNAS